MNKHEAIGWLVAKNWHVTDLRIEALEAGVDLERDCGGCASWSDGGPCTTCIAHAIENRPTAAVN